MDVVYWPGGESIYQVGGSRGGVVAPALLQTDMADDGKRAKTRRVARWTLVSSPGQGKFLLQASSNRKSRHLADFENDDFA